MKTYVTTLAQVLYQTVKGKSKSEVDLLVKRALDLLRRKHLWKDRSDLLKKLKTLHLDQQDKIAVTVISRYALSPAETSSVKEYVREQYKRQAEISSQLDPGVLGGFKVIVGDSVLDATIAGQLKRLQKFLTQENN